jgi:hypothetical protein
MEASKLTRKWYHFKQIIHKTRRKIYGGPLQAIEGKVKLRYW